MKGWIVRSALIVTSLFLASVASAVGGNQPDGSKAGKPASCTNFNVFKDSNGAEIGLCGATKPGGKATVLRSFVIVSVVDPATDKPVRVMVGFR